MGSILLASSPWWSRASQAAVKAPPRPEGPCSPWRGGQDGSEEALTVIAYLTHPTGLCDSEHPSLPCLCPLSHYLPAPTQMEGHFEVRC